MGDAGEAGGLLKLGGRIEHGDEALDDEVVHFLFGIGEFGGFAGGDDGKVVRDFFIIEDAAAFAQAWAVVAAAFEDGGGIRGDLEAAIGDVLHGFADIGGVVFREVAGVGPRIGDELVLFVKRLGNLECALGRKRGLALEGGQVVELRGNLGLRALFLGDGAGLAIAAGADGFCRTLFPQPFGPRVRVGLILFPAFVDPFA